MCFNPTISLTTFLIEFALATFILIKYKKTTMAVFSAIIIYTLGLYQLSEFFLCNSQDTFLWARLGFMIYTVLPALGLHGALMITKKKTNAILIYLIPLASMFFAVTYPSFIASASCETVFVNVSNTFFSDSLFAPKLIYWLYYGGFIILASGLTLSSYKKERSRKTRKTYLWFLAGVLLMVLPTFIFLIALPSFSIRFPSVLCHFALLLAICFFIAVKTEQS